MNPETKLINPPVIREDLTFEEWKKLTATVCALPSIGLWYLGDWAEFGIERFGEQAKQAIAVNCAESKLVLHAATVSKSIPPNRRKASLPWSYHAEVADLPEAEQLEFLELAEKQEMTRSEIRQAIRKSDADMPTGRQASRFNPLKWVVNGMAWFNSQARTEPIERWNPERRAMLKNDLKPLVELYNKL
jgi:hypothetical protein